MPRKKTFTIEFALDKAMELFWERGYQSTSMREIADHLGLSRSSIYATFATNIPYSWKRCAATAPSAALPG